MPTDSLHRFRRQHGSDVVHGIGDTRHQLFQLERMLALRSLFFSIAFASASRSHEVQSMLEFDHNSQNSATILCHDGIQDKNMLHCALEAVITSSRLFETTSNGKFQGVRAKAEDNLGGDMIDQKRQASCAHLLQTL